LALTLFRDTCRNEHDVRTIMHLASHDASHEPLRAVEDYLLARVLPVAYTDRPGERSPRYDLDTADRALRFIARQMNGEATRALLVARSEMDGPRPRA
jgi:hypothetical protein